MSADAIFAIIAIPLIFLFTGYMIWVNVKRTRFLRRLARLLNDAETKQESQTNDEGVT